MVSLSPRLSTVSIMPGIENLAPERTETSRGFLASPNRRPIFFSSAFMCRETSSMTPSGRPPWRRCSLQASVVMVNPGGTGRPRLVISPRLAPLPPSRSFMSRLPCSKS